MRNIFKMERDELLGLKPEEVNRQLQVKEVEHIVKVLGVRWLEPANIKRIMAEQLARRISRIEAAAKVNFVAAVPNGVTNFGHEVADLLKATYACLENIAGRLTLTSSLNPGDRVLLVGGVCSDRQDFTEAIMAIKGGCPGVIIMPFFPVIINLGSLMAIGIEGAGGPFYLISVIKSKALKQSQCACPTRFTSSARKRSKR